MLQRLSIKYAKPGMQVVDAELSWIDNPYLFQEEVLLGDVEQIQAIIDDGYTEIIVDPTKGDPAAYRGMPSDEEEHTPADSSCEESTADTVSHRLEQINLWRELPDARKAYAYGISLVRSLAGSVRNKQPVAMHPFLDCARIITESICRNREALILLSKFGTTENYEITHSINVSIYAAALAAYSGHDQQTINELATAGLLHDIGKFMVPQNVLLKPSPLSRLEFAAMRKHPALSCKYISEDCACNTLSPNILSAIRDHHERYNGSGYPEGREKDSIGEHARILSIADVYDAMTSVRPYRSAMPLHRALRIMYGMNGDDFHPGYVTQFIKSLGVYPVGSSVRLNTGQLAVVAKNMDSDPLRPRVVLATDPLKRPCTPACLELFDSSHYVIEGPGTLPHGLNALRVIEEARGK